MQKLMGKPWSSWNLPDQPTELDLKKLREGYLPPDQYRVHHQSTPLPQRYVSLFGLYPDSDYISLTKCPACGWLFKVQHANQHFVRDSRGAIACKQSDLAFFGDKVLGKASHPVGELKESYSKRITLRSIPPPIISHGKSHGLRGSSAITEMVSKSRSGSHSNKTDYLTHSVSQYRSRSHTSLHAPPPSYMTKSRSGSSTTSSSHNSASLNSSSSANKGKSSSKSHSSSTSSSWSSSLRSPSKGSVPHKSASTTSGSYTLSIPSEDMGVNESVEDLLMSNITHSYGSSKHTVHIIATSNSGNKSKAAADPDYDHLKFYADLPEKRLKLDSHSRSNDHHHKISDSQTSSHDSYSKSKSKHSGSTFNGTVSSHSSSDSKKSKSSLSSKNDAGSSSNKHHLRSTGSSTVVTASKPVVALSSLSSTHSKPSHRLTGSLATYHTSVTKPIVEEDKQKKSISSRLGNIGTAYYGGSSSTSTHAPPEEEKEKVKTSPQKKKKRKRDKDEPRKIIPLKDRDFNPDKHCGVVVSGSSFPCKRSLTCKTHSVASRRAVVGRSQSFDALLAAHKLAKSEEKVIKPKEVVEEIAPPKPKKKKLSGSINTTSTGVSPNDVRPLAGVPDPTTYARAGSPEIEIIEVKAKTKIPVQEYSHYTSSLIHHDYSKPPIKAKAPPMVYPYNPDIQERFEMVWRAPWMLEQSKKITPEERDKFQFLFVHYKNPYYTNSVVSQPLAKNVREKRNVFSMWNACESPAESSNSQQPSWGIQLESRRQASDTEDSDIAILGLVTKK